MMKGTSLVCRQVCETTIAVYGACIETYIERRVTKKLACRMEKDRVHVDNEALKKHRKTYEKDLRPRELSWDS